MTTLSVILCATGATSFDAALRALDAQAQGADIERVLVARRGNRAVESAGAAGWRTLYVAAESPLGQLFVSALRASTAPIVALTTDRFIPAADWVARAAQAHPSPGVPSVVAGAIEVADSAATMTRAVFGCEYAGLAGRLGREAPAANLSLSRPAIDALAALAGPESCDADWGRLFDAAGIPVRVDVERRVRLAHRFTFAGFARERYHFSRALSGARVRRMSAVSRVARVFGTPALPMVLAARLARALRRGPASPAVGRTLPLMLLFTVPWAAGDLVGLVRGPGASARKVG